MVRKDRKDQSVPKAVWDRREQWDLLEIWDQLAQRVLQGTLVRQERQDRRALQVFRGYRDR